MADATLYASAASGEGESPLPKRFRTASESPGSSQPIGAEPSAASREADRNVADIPAEGPSAPRIKGWSVATIESIRRGSVKPPEGFTDFYDFPYDVRRLRILECRAAFKADSGLDPGVAENHTALRKFGVSWGKKQKLHLFDPFSEPEEEDETSSAESEDLDSDDFRA